jgi:ubiquinone biosynthesis monooxygenase Coq7
MTRDNALQQSLLQAADEEHDHLAWCAERVEALGDRTSRLAPLWYGGAFVIGSLAGLAGNRFSLGFLEETERQVGRHLDEHLGRLPARDHTSRRIVAQMKDEELAHGAAARALGAGPLDAPVKAAMGRVSRLMTHLAFWL